MTLKKLLICSLAILSLAAIISPVYAMGKKSKAEKAPSRSAISETQLAASNRLKTESNETLDISWDAAQGTPSFVKGELRSVSGDIENGVRQFITEYRDLYKLDNPAEEFVQSKTETDELNMTHIKFSQVYNNLPLFGQELIVHVRADGMITVVNGHTVATPKISTTPAISEDRAVQLAEADVLGRKPNNKLVSKKQLGILVEETKDRLVWEVRVNSPTNLLLGEIIYVDAQTGIVVRRGTTIMSDGPAVGDGIGVLGQTRPLNTYQFGSVYQMYDASRPMYVPPIDSLRGTINTWDAHNLEDPFSATISQDPNGDNHWNDSQYLRANVDAHYHNGKSDSFYRQAFNRNSYDNAGATVDGFCHFGNGLENAFWNGQYHIMVYGDGAVTFRALCAGYDVAVHELSHAFTGASSNLEYRLQSGAINEHMSDAMACVADSDDWNLGEDVVIVTPFILRSMSDPHQGLSWQPSHMSEYQNLPDTDSTDHGGVHTNSGIPNHAFYLAANALNRLQAGRIWYRANNNYLTQTSQFIDLRNACVQAATDLYGGGSQAVNAVNSAFDQVGVGGGGGPGGGEVNEDFEDNAPDWSVYTTDGNFGVTWDTTHVAYHAGTASAFCSYGFQGEFQDEWLISPAFQLPSSIATLTYYTAFAYPSDANDNHYVKIGTDLNNLNGFVNIQTLTPANMQQIGGSWTVQTLNLSGFTPGNNYYLAFEYRGTYADEWYVDDVTLASPSEAEQPTVVLPNKLELLEPYPNPFNSTTQIQFQLSAASKIELSVYNLLGQKVTSLADNKFFTAGQHQIAWNASDVSSGLYLVRLTSGTNTQSKKLMLIK